MFIEQAEERKVSSQKMVDEQKGIRVLHVDDEPEFLALTKRHLEADPGIHVQSVTSAQDGLDYLKQGDYDVVLSDYQIPVMDGLEFLQKLRERGSTIPFIMFTGRGREEVAIEALNRGADHYIQKGNDTGSMFGTLRHAIREQVAKKRAEEALLESEEKYRNLVERANDSICIIQDSVIKYANPRLAEGWGGTVEEMIETPFTNYVQPDERAHLVDRYRRRMAGEKLPPIYETVLKRKDGRALYAELNAGTITYQGRLADLIIIRDVTERKKAEEALRVSQERYRLITENTTDYICMLTFRGVFTYASPSHKLFGYEPEKLVGRSGLNMIHPDDRKRLLPLLKQYASLRLKELLHLKTESRSERIYFRFPDTAGRWHWLEATANLIEAQDGDGFHILLISRDITEKLEKEILEAQSEMRTILTDSIPVLLQGAPHEKVNIFINQMCNSIEALLWDRYLADAKQVDMKVLGTVLCEIMNEMGGEFAIKHVKAKQCSIQGSACPWGLQAQRNPVLCMVCRGIFSRLALKVFKNVDVKLETSIANKDDCCTVTILVYGTA